MKKRIRLLAPGSGSAALARGETSRGEQTGAAERCAFFVPLHYEANYPYPVLIWLHGAGEDERRLARVMPQISLRNYVAAAPCGEVRSPAGGRDWRHTPEGIASAAAAVAECLRRLREQRNVDPGKVFLAGVGSGGTMALRLALRDPDTFAGGASVGGPFPRGAAPLAGLARARRTPLFLAHARGSLAYPVDQACEDLRLFHAAGLTATLRQYPEGDEPSSRMLHDLNLWLMEQVTGGPLTADEDACESGRA